MIFRKLTVKDIRKETAECVSVAFEIPDAYKEAFRFKQGQNITIRTRLDGEEIRRTYSICSSPLDNELRIAVKKVMPGRFSGHANLHLKPGDVLEVLPPTGKFLTELHPGQKKNYVAFAAGSGITPVLSIIKTTLAVEAGSSFTLVYGNRYRNSIIFKEELEALKNKYMHRFSVHHILSGERTDAPVYRGRITAEKCVELSRLINFSASDDIFICGPESMIFGVKNFMLQQGIPPNHIHYEFFGKPVQSSIASGGASSSAEHHAGKKSTVLVRADGITYTFELPYDQGSILEGALQQGADLPYACKGGVCSTCRARLVEGRVDMAVHYALEQDDMDAGFILTCQAQPRSEQVVVDFDVK